MIGNDSLNIITDNVLTNDSGFYSYSFPMNGSFARVDIVTPDCNGTMLSSSIVIDSSMTSVVQDFSYCNLIICQAFFIYEQTGDYTFQFTDQSTGQDLNYFWDFGDNMTSSDQNPSHTYNSPGIFDVCLFISSSDSTCFDAYCTQVVAGSGGGCVAQFTWYPDSLPAGNAVQFVDLSSGNITEWSWSFGDGTFSQEQNPLHIFPEQGSYEVCLSITGPECQSTWCEFVTVNGTGDCYNYFTYQGAGTTVMFQGENFPPAPSIFSWDFGDGTTGEGQSISHNYAQTGVYYVTLNTSDSSGCFATSSQSVVVGDTILFNQVYGQVFEGNLPMLNGYVMISSVQNNPGFTPYTDTTPVDSSGIYLFPYVPNGEYVLYAVPEDANGYMPTYFGDVLHWDQAPAINSTEAGILMNIVLSPVRSAPAFGNGSINGFINGLNPLNGLDGMMNVLLYNENYESVTFSRVQQDGSFVFDGLAVGTYYLYPELPGVLSSYFQVVVTDITYSATVYLNYDGTSVLGEEENVLTEDDIRVYPNPASDHATLSINCRQPGELALLIIDLTGRVCFSIIYLVNSGESLLEIPVQELIPGIYLLHISDTSGKVHGTKFIKK
jgi:PKD repeat protein